MLYDSIEMFPLGKYIETESILLVAREWKRSEFGATAKDGKVSFWGNGSVLD